MSFEPRVLVSKQVRFGETDERAERPGRDATALRLPDDCLARIAVARPTDDDVVALVPGQVGCETEAEFRAGRPVVNPFVLETYHVLKVSASRCTRIYQE